MKLHTYLLLSLLALSPRVIAQVPAGAQPLPEPPPPPASASQSADAAAEDAPEVTIRRKGEDKVEEYRLHGKLYMIKITPKIGKPYYLVDQKGDGVFARYDGLDSGLKVPRWIVKSW